MLTFVVFFTLALVVGVVYKQALRLTHSRFFAAGSAVAGLGVFILAADLVLHVIGAAL